MNKQKLTVAVGNIEDAAKEFIKIWHQVESGNLPKDIPIEKISFSDQRLLFKTLTPKRCDLLRYVHEHGKMSIRAMATKLKRDYSNVYQDVKTLSHIGLILKDEKDEKYSVPWDMIVTEISMNSSYTANKSTAVKRHQGRPLAHAAHR